MPGRTFRRRRSSRGRRSCDRSPSCPEACTLAGKPRRGRGRLDTWKEHQRNELGPRLGEEKKLPEEDDAGGDDRIGHQGADAHHVDEVLQVEHGGHRAGKEARENRGQERRVVLGADGGQGPGDEPVGGHRVEDAREGEHGAEEGGGEAEEGADRDDGAGKVPADGVEGVRERGVDVLLVVGDLHTEQLGLTYNVFERRYVPSA